MVLGSTAVGAGLGLGLFGVLSIIRLRSDEIAQHEIAYHFAALALGLLAGLSGAPTVLATALMALILLTLFVSDHPGLFRRYRQQTMHLDVRGRGHRHAARPRPRADHPVPPQDVLPSVRRCPPHRGHPAGVGTPGRSEVCTPQWAVVETKSAARASAADRLLWSLHHRPRVASKYGTGLAALRPDLPSNRWRPALRIFPTAPTTGKATATAGEAPAGGGFGRQGGR